MIEAINHWLEQFLQRQAARGKWSFVVRIGLLAWGIPMLCAVNGWFGRWTRYPRLTVFLLSLALWLPAGIAVGLGFYENARRTPNERRERCLELMRRGPISFVWRYGILGFGGTMFLAFSILIVLILRTYPGPVLTWIFALCLLAGFICGVVFWSLLEKTYNAP
jgi:hypothetical protein